MTASTAHLNFGLAKPEVLNDRRRLLFPRVNHPSGSGFFLGMSRRVLKIEH